ncbi:hypothetical protein Dda_4982 [Drechslerella dactyloides]|uniref:FAR-17a/AIG1-like protein n=1 Tax=Drechslerella dactyloides TaxID=74499 RepID=A0AAD6NL48_DREDA|nr:hypothetical protein Dda_4982 [Drechslerella dactyloides]
MSRFYELTHVSPAHPLSRFFTSWLLPTPVFLAYRAFLCLYAVLVIIISNSLTPDDAGSRFSYFTWLTFWGITCYLIVSTAHTFSYWRYGRAWLEDWPKPLQFLHVLYYSTIVVLPWTVTAVYWAVLFDKFDSEYQAWSNVRMHASHSFVLAIPNRAICMLSVANMYLCDMQISVHALNAVIAFLEIVVPRSEPLPWMHIPLFMPILGGYLAIAYITKATQGFYTYSFLDPKRSGSGVTAAYCIGILIGTVLLFSIVKGLIWVRMWATERKLGMMGKFSERDPRREIEVDGEEDIEEMKRVAV